MPSALGNLVGFNLLPGQPYAIGVGPLLTDVAFKGLIADKAFDTAAVIADLNPRKARIIITQHPRRSKPLDIDLDIYNWRHPMENVLFKLKAFKRIALQSGKTDTSFTAMIYFSAAVINS
jgi:hypothetical protein